MVKTVLVVEDDDPILDVIGWALQDEGHAIRTAHTVTDAMTQIDSARPDAIVLDLGLSGGDGRLLIEACLQDDRLRAIPVIALTARSSDDDVDGAVVVLKSFDVAELAATVTRVVAGQPAG